MGESRSELFDTLTDNERAVLGEVATTRERFSNSSKICGDQAIRQ
jgi:hypothetical protein